MTDPRTWFDEVLAFAERLSPRQRWDLVQRLLAGLERDLKFEEPRPLEGYRGALAHLDPSPTDEDFAEARKAMLQNFPREDD